TLLPPHSNTHTHVSLSHFDATYTASLLCSVFSFTATPTPAIYTVSLHDALPIFDDGPAHLFCLFDRRALEHSEEVVFEHERFLLDRKSTRLNSSHRTMSYAVFCLKKKALTRWITGLDSKSSPLLPEL